MKSNIRWGIIGCGDVTEVKSGPAFQKIPQSELQAVMRRNGELAKDYAIRHHVPAWYSDAEKLVSDDEVDAIYIATPPAFHKEYTLLAAKYRKPVYVEKPMATDYQQCLDMVDACKKANTPLFVAYYRRALPKFLKIKELLDKGEIGDPRFVKTTQFQKSLNVADKDTPWRVDPAIAGGGLFFDVASHTLDILDFLLGSMKEVKGFATNQLHAYEAEDIVTGTYLFESGVHGTGTWCFSSYENEDINEIVGSKGKLVFSTFGHEPVQLITESSKQEWTFDRPPHIQQPLITTIVEELLGKGRSPSTGETAARTNWVMEEMTKGYY
ncbi:Gfo/Idh/MocA family protein [Salipaludibacillus sp. HK11]|uniref:Gfo/Idh/MocA family protein n=1 Tax=Salipaludibacillus sp. HK11 TaxID=3394320 RepID=UPI0039FD3717